MSDSDDNRPGWRHVGLVDAAAKADEARVRDLLADGELWWSHWGRNALRQALQKAAACGHQAIAQLLLERGADVHARGHSEMPALFRAAEKGHYDVARLLVKHRADPNERSATRLRLRQTPLFVAALRGHVEIVRLLLDHGADCQLPDMEGRTPLLVLAQNESQMNPDVVRLLVARGGHALVEARDNAGHTALMTAVSTRNRRLVPMLLDGSLGVVADALAANKRGRTALHLAAEAGDEAVARLLLEAKADTNAVSDGGWTPLHNAAVKGHAGVVVLLLQSAADANAQMLNGMTPLHWAALHGHKKVVVALLSRSETMLSLRDTFGRTPLLCAAEGGHRGVVEMLAPEHAAQRLPRCARAACNLFEATIVDVGRFRDGKRKRLFRKSVFDVLYRQRDGMSAVPTLVTSSNDELRFRWIHLPANNIAWVEMPFIHYETDERRQNMHQAIDLVRRGLDPPREASGDVQLLKGYLLHKPPLHPRRTLSQFKYHSNNTSARDADQVVTRYCQRHNMEKKVLMVDQLWLFVLGEGLVLSCFPQRWDQPSRDPLNVMDGIVEEVNARAETSALGTYDLAMLIVSRCSGMPGRFQLDDPNFQFLPMFQAAIGNIHNMERGLFERFHKASHISVARMNAPQARLSGHAAAHRLLVGSVFRDEQDFSDALLGIDQETVLLTELEDVREELKILTSILAAQLTTVDELERSIVAEIREVVEHEYRWLYGNDGNDGAVRARPPSHDDRLLAPQRQAREQRRVLTAHQADIEHIDQQAEDVRVRVLALMDLKQRHADALEARFAHNHARSNALTAARQGQTLMLFTIVTIVFLPMSFIAALFSIQVREWQDGLALARVAKYTFGIGLGISIPLIVLALAASDLYDAAHAVTTGAWKLKARRPARRRASDAVGGGKDGEGGEGGEGGDDSDDSDALSRAMFRRRTTFPATAARASEGAPVLSGGHASPRRLWRPATGGRAGRGRDVEEGAAEDAG